MRLPLSIVVAVTALTSAAVPPPANVEEMRGPADSMPDQVIIDTETVLAIESQENATIESDGDIIVKGRIVVRPADGEIDAPCLILKARGSIIIEGTIELADGGDSDIPWHRGGRGASVSLNAPIVLLSNDLRAGDGGNGGPMGDGGPGGAITARGVLLGAQGPVTIFGGNGAPGSDGSAGDESHPEGRPGGGGGQGGMVILEAGWLDRPEDLVWPNRACGLHGASAVGGNGGRGGNGGAAVTESDRYATGGYGGRGGDGGDADASGGAPGRSGSPGGSGGEAKGGYAGKGGDAGEPVRSRYVMRYGGTGGRGGSAVGGSGAFGAPGGAGGDAYGGRGGGGGFPGGGAGAAGSAGGGNGGNTDAGGGGGLPLEKVLNNKERTDQ